jgi:hypothetical protein
MMVVPTGGKLTGSVLGSGPTEWWTFADAVGDAPVLVAVATADADDAGGPDDPLFAGAEPEPGAAAGVDPPPHAASSRTIEAIPVAAAHPLLRITSLQFTGMTRSSGKPGRAFQGRAGH